MVASAHSFDLTWTAITEARSYRLYRRRAQDTDDFVLLYDGPHTAFTDTALEANRSYEYLIEIRMTMLMGMDTRGGRDRFSSSSSSLKASKIVTFTTTTTSMNTCSADQGLIAQRSYDRNMNVVWTIAPTSLYHSIIIEVHTHISRSIDAYIYIYIYKCVCVCVGGCVCQRSQWVLRSISIYLSISIYI
jgi:hypothetical protein